MEMSAMPAQERIILRRLRKGNMAMARTRVSSMAPMPPRWA